MIRNILKKITAVFLCLLISSSAFASHVTVHFSEDQTVTLRKDGEEYAVDPHADLISADEDETETEAKTEADSVSGIEPETETEPETEAEAETESELYDGFPEKRFHETTGMVEVFVDAPEGAFPEGTTMSVTDVEDEETISAIEEAVSSQISRIHAVDIIFFDAEGNEIKPLVPVRVILSAEEKQESEETLVIHVDNEGQAEQIPAADVSAENGEESPSPLESDNTEIVSKKTLSASGIDREKKYLAAAPPQSLRTQAVDEADVLEKEGQDEKPDEVPEHGAGVQFTTDQFSVYALVYTVDFHFSVNGKTYEFCLPGGGFVSFSKLVEVLGITEAADSGNSEIENKEKTDENRAETSETEDDVVITDAAREFVANVENIEFSSPDLIWVGKIENGETVGEIKEENRLDIQYSAKLTEAQIAEINETVVEPGDWALISMQPFESEETLTVTMKDGEQFVVKVTDAQLHTYVISDSGDTYEVIVTYDDTAEIPEGAELKVREISADSKEFADNVRIVNKELAANSDSEISNPVQLDISIVFNGEVVEPKEGSNIKVEIKLAKSLFGVDDSAEGESERSNSARKDFSEKDAGETDNPGNDYAAGDGAENVSAPEAENESPNEKKGLILINGQEYSDDSSDLTACRVAHIADNGRAEIIGEVHNSVTDNKVIMRFDTESFSDYLFDGNSSNGLYNLPSTIYVGDEIYMWHQGDMWVTNIGSVVTETKHDNNDNFKTVTAISPGTFRIVHRNDWNNGNPYQNYKEITVLPARTGTTPPATIETVDNASIGLTLNLFDYDLDGSLDSYFNNYNHGDHPVQNAFLNESGSINNGHALKFWGSGIGNNHGSQNQYQEHGVTNIVNRTTDTGDETGYPVLRTDNTSLRYLFSPSSGTDKTAYTNVNGLFKKVDDYYVYDSNSNYAYYDVSQGSGGSFTVYNSTYNQKSGGENGSIQQKAIGFFPFHKWDDQYDLYVNWNKNLNHHFGMSMSVGFSLPKDPKAVVDTEGNPIVFEFSGDDDLWVFIDGKLAMDIGGIHQPTSGTIDFKNQTVIANGVEQSFDFSDLYDGEKHTLQVFYIERGGCDSNCMIKFNLTQYGHVEFDKVDKDNPSDKLKGAVFGIYKDAGCTQPLMENLKDGTSRAYIAESDESGHVRFSDIPLGNYYLKELKAPDGYPLDSTVHSVRVYLDEHSQVVVKVSIDGIDVEDGVEIPNKMPEPIDLGLE